MTNNKNHTGKFYELSVEQRLNLLAEESDLSADDLANLSGRAGLNETLADQMIENVVGMYALPLAVARNFLINGRDVQVLMVIEEPSVVAAASFMAKLVRAGGGFTASTSAPEMIGQMQVLDMADIALAKKALKAERKALLAAADESDPLLKKLGGGARDLLVRVIDESPIGSFLVIHLIMDVRDAMGANAVNTALERLSPMVERISGGRVLLRILSNLADRRLAKAACAIPLEALATEGFSGEEVRDRIIEAWAFADADPYRAATHNKGIMNGVDAVVLATGNDWRAVEAGAHAYAAHSGKYTSLSKWSKGKNGDLIGELEMPLAVGIVGGATRVHPGARAALKLLGVSSARELAEVIVSVGLAQNLGALRALATEGIQRGHMALHARQVAAAAGAPPEMVSAIAEQMVKESHIHVDRAVEILRSWRGK
jgi:hydroxymethylglutaryl-CoA reductase